MPAPTKAHIESVVLSSLARLCQRPSIEVHANQSLLEFVDSFGFVNLLLEVEADLGFELDLSHTDVADLVFLDGLIGFIQEQGGRADIRHDPAGEVGSGRPEQLRTA